MNMNQLAKLITKLEKGKSEVNVAQIKEILKIVNMIMYKQPETVANMINNGKRNIDKGVKL